jgi:hypothetical protein
MSELAPTIDARPVDELLQQHLEHVPPHIAEELGELSLRLSHVNMFEQSEKTSDRGHNYTETNFERNITNPDHDSSALQAEAVEAAHAGKEKISHLLSGSAELLGQAHAKLEQEGFSFLQPEAENDAKRDQREAHEKESVYETAYTLAIEKAKALREAGDTRGAIDTMDSVIILRDVKEKDNPRPDRKVFRDAVRAGLGNELLTACQESKDIYVDTSHHKLGKNIDGAKNLLSYATGKSIDYDLSVMDKPLQTIDNVIQDEEITDLLAVLSMPDAPLKLSSLPEHSGLVVLQKLKELDVLPAEERQKALDTMYQVIESTNKAEVMIDLYKSTDNPTAVAEAIKLLGIEPWQAKSIFVTHERDERGLPSEKGVVNTGEIKNFEKFISENPEDSQLVIGALTNNPGLLSEFKGLDIKATSEALQVLRSNDMMTNELIEQVARGVSPESFNQLVTYFDDISNILTTPASELLGMLESSDIKSIIRSLASSAESPEIASKEIREGILYKLTESQLKDFYTKRFTEADYPISKESLPEVQLSDLPFLEKRLRGTGLSDELVLDIFKSWSTYSALNQHYYNNRSTLAKGGKLEDIDVKNISIDQSQAFLGQMKALEKSLEVLGAENTQEIIDSFGIYNFSRHKTEDLGNQLERWKSGEKVQSVVVEARADWNSYTGKGAKFSDEVGDGVFYFEANSGTETARVAVNVGQRERSLGREPDVSRFIVHAHGNSRGMIMGVNDERINISGYLEAMEKAQKIRSTESNDFKRHLGPNFEVILQSCSTAGEIAGSKNIAKMISETHGTTVKASEFTIYGVNILSDGSVQFSTNEENGKTVIYQPK